MDEMTRGQIVGEALTLLRQLRTIMGDERVKLVLKIVMDGEDCPARQALLQMFKEDVKLGQHRKGESVTPPLCDTLDMAL